MNKYHENFIDPLQNQIHILTSDFDSYKTSTNPQIYYPPQQSPLNKDYTNDLLINSDEANALFNTNNNRNLEYEQPYFNFQDIYHQENSNKEVYPILEPTNPNNFDTKEVYPILEPTNPNNFDTFLSSTFLKSPVFKSPVEVETVEEDEDEEENEPVVQAAMIPQYLSKVNNINNLRYINSTEDLKINTQGLTVKQLQSEIMKKLYQGKDKSAVIVYLPADKLSDIQLSDGGKIKQKKGK